MASRPSVSFVLPVYNGAEYLRPALASLRWQTVADWEAVCVDDGSTDATPELLARFAAEDPRFRVYRQPNGGIVSALNRGLAESRGEWIARMDADDLATPDRLERQLAAAESQPDAVLIGGAVVSVDPEGDPIRLERLPTTHEAITSGLLAGRHAVAHPTVLMRREAALDAGAYRHEYEWVEDVDLWLRLAERGRLANLPDPVLWYRLHTGSVCWNRRAEQQARVRRLLDEAHRRRGLTPPAHRESKPRPQSDARGKWARQAAKAGQLSVAWKWSRRLAIDKPFSLSTARVLAEAATRGGLALATGRQDAFPPVPDWRAWDVAPAARVSAAA